MTSPIPADWTPKATMSRVILHWTAGSHKATDFDREHYHVLIEGDSKVVRGFPSIALNSEPKAKKGYAAHTLNCNTGSIGVSLCCMAGAIERPLNVGKYPLTRSQWEAASSVVAELCKRYGIAVSSRTVLSHAEVQVNLGITQRGKWDIAILPFDQSYNTAKKVGDRFRAEVAARLAGKPVQAPPNTPAAKPTPPVGAGLPIEPGTVHKLPADDSKLPAKNVFLAWLIDVFMAIFWRKK